MNVQFVIRDVDPQRLSTQTLLQPETPTVTDQTTKNFNTHNHCSNLVVQNNFSRATWG